MAVVEFVCEACQIKLNTDQVELKHCLKCGRDMELVFKREWVGSIESGQYETFEKKS